MIFSPVTCRMCVQIHPWVTRYGTCPMPQEGDNCVLVTITEEEVYNSVKVIPKLETLVSLRSCKLKLSTCAPEMISIRVLRGAWCCVTDSCQEHLTQTQLPTSVWCLSSARARCRRGLPPTHSQPQQSSVHSGTRPL